MRQHLIIVVIFVLALAKSLAQCGFSPLSSTYCTNGSTVQLSPFVSGGTFYGNGVTGAIFDPGAATSGSQIISYSYCVSNYSLETPVFVQASYNPTFLSMGDNSISAALPIGFNFRFFCNTYSQFYISSNGFITFTPPQNSGCCQGLPLPTTTQGEMIALAWTDLDPSQGGTIRYSHLGTAPNRTLLVSFNCIFHKQGQGPVTAEILLEEGTNAIELSTFIKPVPTGTITYNTTMGIQNASGTAAYIVPGRNGTSNWTASQEQIRFIPEPSCNSSQTVHIQQAPTVYALATKTNVCAGEKVILSAYGAGAYSWLPGNFPYATFSVAPTSPVIYTITGTAGSCSSTSTLAINVTACTGLEDASYDPENRINIYPVPSTGEITISAEVSGKFLLYDSKGSLIRELLFSKNSPRYTLSNLENGFYFLYSPDTVGRFVQKIVVSH